MPPDGYTMVTISDSAATKLTRIMASHDRSSCAEAIDYAADTTLVQEGEITVQELIQVLAKRLDEVDETKFTVEITVNIQFFSEPLSGLRRGSPDVPSQRGPRPLFWRGREEGSTRRVFDPSVWGDRGVVPSGEEGCFRRVRHIRIPSIRGGARRIERRCKMGTAHIGAAPWGCASRNRRGSRGRLRTRDTP